MPGDAHRRGLEAVRYRGNAVGCVISHNPFEARRFRVAAAVPSPTHAQERSERKRVHYGAKCLADIQNYRRHEE